MVKALLWARVIANEHGLEGVIMRIWEGPK